MSPEHAGRAPAGIRNRTSNAANNSITVYAPEVTGDAKPVAVLSGAHTGLGNPSAITIDGRGRLWVANLATNSLTVYPVAADGDAAPVARVQGRRPGSTARRASRSTPPATCS